MTDEMEYVPSGTPPSPGDLMDAIRKSDGETFDTAIRRAHVRRVSRSWVLRVLGWLK